MATVVWWVVLGCGWWFGLVGSLEAVALQVLDC